MVNFIKVINESTMLQLTIGGRVSSKTVSSLRRETASNLYKRKMNFKKTHKEVQ